MKLLIAAFALLSFVATSTLPETVVAQAATGQTQTAPATPDTGMKAPTHHSKSKKHHKKKAAKKHTSHKPKHKRSSKHKKPASSTNPS